MASTDPSGFTEDVCDRFSALIRAELWDVTHQLGKGWRHGICVLEIPPGSLPVWTGGIAWGIGDSQVPLQNALVSYVCFPTTSPLKTAECLSGCDTVSEEERSETFIGQPVTTSCFFSPCLIIHLL